MQLQADIFAGKTLGAACETHVESGNRASNLFLFMPRCWPIIASPCDKTGKVGLRASMKIHTRRFGKATSYGTSIQPSGGSHRPPETQIPGSAQRPGRSRLPRRRRK